MKKVIVISVILLILCIGSCCLLVNQAQVQINKCYNTPDTSITVHNGKADTIISKKSQPSFLK